MSTANTRSLTARVGTFTTGHLLLKGVELNKQSAEVRATALLTSDALAAALPSGFTLRPLTSPAGELMFRGSSDVLGTHVALTARLVAHDRALVIEPDIVGFFPSFLSVTVFRDPRIDVESVGSRAVAGGWELSATAKLTTS